MNKELIIDDRFRILEMPHEANAVDSVTERIIRTGITPEFLTWQNHLLLDFQIYERILPDGLSYTAKEIPARTRNEAVSWICSNQLERHDLTTEYYRYLTGKKYMAELDLQKEAAETQDADYSSLRTRIPKRTKLNIAGAIADDLDLSRATVMKYGFFAQAVDRIFELNTSLSFRILSRRIFVSHANVLAIAELSKEETDYLCMLADKKDPGRIGSDDIAEAKTKCASPSVPAVRSEVRREPEEPLIRQMPAFDPDSEISSLSLTIPSWISSMERANRQTIYEDTSVSARISLIKQLAVLEKTISVIQKEIEEAY